MRPTTTPLAPDPSWLDFTGFVPPAPSGEWPDFIGYVPPMDSGLPPEDARLGGAGSRAPVPVDR